MVAVIARTESASDRAPVRDSIGAPHPTVPRVSARAMFRLHPLLEPNRLWYRLALLLESTPALYRAFTWVERRVKNREFGCRMCGQCALPSTAYACPQTCPKQLRNGPCGGVSAEGRCEVYPDLRCVWVVAYERAEREGRVADLRRLQRPIDHRRWGESSWVNYWRGRDDDLWTADDGLGSADLPFVERGRGITHEALGGGTVASGSVGVSSAAVTD
ncbi:MAG: methylenetetrahydrofolate reductase C-terminal domain-containing protein, partial [Dehalococcoidia bacterium]